MAHGVSPPKERSRSGRSSGADSLVRSIGQNCAFGHDGRREARLPISEHAPLSTFSAKGEELTDYRRPQAFAYRVSEFTNPIRHLASEARGRWRFSATEGGTEVEWVYTFRAHNAVAALPLSFVAKTFWSGYMQTCLDNAKRLLDNAVAHRQLGADG